MQDISFDILPIRDHAFFQQPELQGLLGNDFFQLARFTAKGAHLSRGGGTSRIASEPTLASLKKFLRPFVIDTLRDAFTAAKLGNGFLTTQAI